MGSTLIFPNKQKNVSAYLPVTGITFLEEDDDLIKTVDSVEFMNSRTMLIITVAKKEKKKKNED